MSAVPETLRTTSNAAGQLFLERLQMDRRFLAEALTSDDLTTFAREAGTPLTPLMARNLEAAMNKIRSQIHDTLIVARYNVDVRHANSSGNGGYW